MSVKFCWTRRVAIFLGLFAMMGFVASCGLLFPGATGPEGPQGPQGDPGAAGTDGAQGPSGLNAGDTLPLTIVTITGVNGGSPVSIGSAWFVDFTIEDDGGNAIPQASLDRIRANVGGISSNYHLVVSSLTITTTAVQNADGSYRYTFDPFPAAFLAPIGGTTSPGATTNGTYTVELEARRLFTVDGVSVRKAGDATMDFLVGAGTIAHREIVTEAACNTCHVNLSLHGGSRTLVTGCVICHTPGATADSGAVSIRLADMIHSIHRGADLPNVKATANGADPYLYEIGTSNFSNVVFPFMPGGTGFNEQTRNCQACHGGAAQEALTHADASINQANCKSCHDDIDFTDGKILNPANAFVIAGSLTKAQLTDPAFRTTPGTTPHVLIDGSCKFCHGDGAAYSSQTVHVPQLNRAANLNGIQVVIDSVTGSANPNFFAIGERPVITFRVLDGTGTALNIATDSAVQRVEFVMSGPVGNYQKVLPATSTAKIKNYTGTFPGGAASFSADVTPQTGTGPFTYTVAAIPAVYPAVDAGGPNYDYARGWGELEGRALDPGNYTLLVYANRQVTIDGTNYRETSEPALAQIRIGAAGATDGYPGFVTDAKCNACHGSLRFHGSGRKSVKECVMCHVAGVELGAPLNSADFKIMIHRIHKDTTPVMPDGIKNCADCHATDAWKTPVERTDVNIWKVACTSCHDSDAAKAHVQLNTVGGDVLGTEACGTCHGAGKPFAVETMHATP
jgi:OmcA/MtrC family decaheme c-type cytochrome